MYIERDTYKEDNILNSEEIIQEVKRRLESQRIGDRLVIERDKYGFSVHAEFREDVGQLVRSNIGQSK